MILLNGFENKCPYPSGAAALPEKFQEGGDSSPSWWTPWWVGRAPSHNCKRGWAQINSSSQSTLSGHQISRAEGSKWGTSPSLQLLEDRSHVRWIQGGTGSSRKQGRKGGQDPTTDLIIPVREKGVQKRAANLLLGTHPRWRSIVVRRLAGEKAGCSLQGSMNGEKKSIPIPSP